mgnify:CR=1 FL=1
MLGDGACWGRLCLNLLILEQQHWDQAYAGSLDPQDFNVMKHAVAEAGADNSAGYGLGWSVGDSVDERAVKAPILGRFDTRDCSSWGRSRCRRPVHR